MTTYDPNKTYAVKLSRSVKVGAFLHKPLNEIEMAGSVLLAIIEAEGKEVIDYAKQV